MTNRKIQSRATLKGYFVRNAIPTEEQFAELIDSCINRHDDAISPPENKGDPVVVDAGLTVKGSQILRQNLNVDGTTTVKVLSAEKITTSGVAIGEGPECVAIYFKKNQDGKKEPKIGFPVSINESGLAEITFQGNAGQIGSFIGIATGDADIKLGNSVDENNKENVLVAIQGVVPCKFRKKIKAGEWVQISENGVEPRISTSTRDNVGISLESAEENVGNPNKTIRVILRMYR